MCECTDAYLITNVINSGMKSNILVSSTVRFDVRSWELLTTVSRAMLCYAISAWPM